MLLSPPWLLLPLAVAVAAFPHHDKNRRVVVDTSTLKGKWLYGYQGWFRKPANGVNNHWTGASGGTPGPGNVDIDFIPDVSQYPPECLFDTDFTLPGGSKAKFYDNTCEGVVDLHFKLMQEAGVDGVLVQRFLGYIGDSSFTTVLNQVRAAAEKYGLGFVVEYDVSGGDSSKASVATQLLDDYNSFVKPYTSSSAYIHQDGKPVVMAFGVGFTSFKVSAADAKNLVNGMKSAGTYFGIGTETQWASLVTSNSDWAPALKAADFISPWTVGAYSYAGYPDYFKTQQSDTQLASSLGIEYAPVIWPGTSADHLNGGNSPAHLDYFPRYNGSFYGKQANSVISLDPLFIFTAMFDEVNEGTGSYPVLKVDQLPTNEVFVGIDNDFASTNHYLTIGGELAATFHSKQ